MAGVNPQEFLEFTRQQYLSKQPILTPAQYQKTLKKPDSS
jgi:hypothetical protein